MTATVVPFPDRRASTAPAGDGPSPTRPAPTTPGHAVLDAVAEFIGRFVVFPTEHCLPTVALWAAHTWAAHAFYTTPRLVLDSAEPGSGKTRVLELLNLFCRDPEMVLSPTTAAIFRMLADRPYSLLFDETDAVFNPRNAAGNYEDLRALLNAGYKRTATIPRCVGDAKSMKVQRFAVFAPVALAGLAGNMPATITTRAVTIHMRRRAPGEHVEPFEEEDAEAAAEPIRAALAGWIEQTGAQVRTRPTLPDGVVDRAAEVWRPLVAVADAAGGNWPDLARAACQHFALDAGPGPLSLGVRLLADLRAIYTRLGADRLTTIDVLKELTALDEAPWADLYGKPLDARRLARELARYDVHPGPLRIGGDVFKGYQATGPTGLADAWSRYLPHTDPPAAVTSVTPVTPQARGVTDPEPVTATAVTADPPGPPAEDHVTDASVTPPAAVTPLTRQVTDVTDATAAAGTGPTPDTAHHYGRCHGCGRQTNRYGPGGNAYCATCRPNRPGGAG
jgi:Protein of unknown function (DUF3631)